MTELKSADEWDKLIKSNFSHRNLIQHIQRNAIEATLEIASEEAEIHYPAENNLSPCVNRKSITSLKNHEKLKV